MKKPIPHLDVPNDWRHLLVAECSEPLVSLRKMSGDRISVKPEYYIQGIPKAIDDCLCRTSVADRLVKAALLLPEGHSLQILDAWRPVFVQKAIFDRRIEQLRELHPNLTTSLLGAIASKDVARPEESGPYAPPHNTGGAIDLTIVDGTGKSLNMGTAFDDFGPVARTRFFEEKIERGEALSCEEREAMKNRRLLFHAMAEVGFSNNPDEWWHFNYGNQPWAASMSVSPIYGTMDFWEIENI